MPTDAEIDAALDAVIRAARHHRAVLKSQVATDEEIWVAYTTLNNASVHYDDLVNQTYDEVTRGTASTSIRTRPSSRPLPPWDARASPRTPLWLRS